MKILLIDDDLMTQDAVALILVADGNDVFTAEDGLHAMELFHREKPALVVTDIFMPLQDGIETILAIRREDTDVKIIAVSGGGQTGMTGSLTMARLLGANEVIEKPFRTDELLARIHSLIPGVAAPGERPA